MDAICAHCLCVVSASAPRICSECKSVICAKCVNEGRKLLAASGEPEQRKKQVTRNTAER